MREEEESDLRVAFNKIIEREFETESEQNEASAELAQYELKKIRRASGKRAEDADNVAVVEGVRA